MWVDMVRFVAHQVEKKSHAASKPVGRSASYKRSGAWAVKKKNGGKFPVHKKAAKPEAKVCTVQLHGPVAFGPRKVLGMRDVLSALCGRVLTLRPSVCRIYPQEVTPRFYASEDVPVPFTRRNVAKPAKLKFQR